MNPVACKRKYGGKIGGSIAVAVFLLGILACDDSGSSDSVEPDADTDADVDNESDRHDVRPEQEPTACTHTAVEEDCTDGWCRIPAGCFQMGSPPTVPCRAMYTEPLLAIELTYDFEIKQTEVTLAEWKAAGYPIPSGQPISDNKPVVFVNWFEAASFCNWLSESAGLESCYDLSSCTGDLGGGCAEGTGCDGSYICGAPIRKYEKPFQCRGYRLATAAEWEYAARAGTTTSTYNGDITTDKSQCWKEPVLDDIAWYCDNTEGLQPVRGKRPNGWGLFDILGNAKEWTDHVYTARGLLHEEGGTPPLVDPIGANEAIEERRSQRGGSFNTVGCYTRSARFNGYSPERRTYYSGIRPVRTVAAKR